MSRLLRDPAILTALGILIIVVLLTIMPVVRFYMRYIEAPKGLHRGAHLAYVLILGICDHRFTPRYMIVSFTNFTYNGGNIVKYSIDIYNATSVAISDKRVHLLHARLLCRANGTVGNIFWRLFAIPANTKIVSLYDNTFLRRDGALGITVSSFGGSPSRPYGYVLLEKWFLQKGNATCTDRDGCVVTTIADYDYSLLEVYHIADFAVAKYHLDRGAVVYYVLRSLASNCGSVAKVADEVRKGQLKVCGEDIVLQSIDFYPRRQYFLYALYASFMSLFPVNFLLIGVSVVIIAARVRGWL